MNLVQWLFFSNIWCTAIAMFFYGFIVKLNCSLCPMSAQVSRHFTSKQPCVSLVNYGQMAPNIQAGVSAWKRCALLFWQGCLSLSHDDLCPTVWVSLGDKRPGSVDTANSSDSNKGLQIRMWGIQLGLSHSDWGSRSSGFTPTVGSHFTQLYPDNEDPCIHL